jgi:multimeric flavodoxin WrbA
MNRSFFSGGNAMDRRRFINSSLATGVAIAGFAPTVIAESDQPVKIVGLACSPRKGKTTAASVRVALEAAKQVDSRIQTELIDLGGLTFSGWKGSEETPKDDFDRIVLPKLRDPVPDGMIVGSPVYFRNASSLCMAFLERLTVLRKPALLLADTVVGVLSVGAYRNGGQELVIQQIQAAMLCHEAFLVGGKPGAHQGATLWNAYEDDITKDEFGIDSARKLGVRVAEAALLKQQA